MLEMIVAIGRDANVERNIAELIHSRSFEDEQSRIARAISFSYIAFIVSRLSRKLLVKACAPVGPSPAGGRGTFKIGNAK